MATIMVGLSAFFLCSVGPASATDHIAQDGRKSGSSTSDGSYARLVGNGFSPKAGQCVIYSAISADFTSRRQVEAGVVRCSGMTIDKTCPRGKAFVERYDGANYYCRSGYAFDNNTEYDATTYRTGSQSTTFTAHINGQSISQGGFGLNDNIRALAWGEVTGTSTTCPTGFSKGTFKVWQRYDTSSGWHYITGSSKHNESVGMTGTPCWKNTSATSSIGAFNVD